MGTFLVILSSVAFGAMALFARLAYADGVTPVSLLFLRFTIASAIMISLVAVRRDRFPRGITLLGLILMGGIGYVGQSLSFFSALLYANAGLVALLLYLYPAIVAILAAIFYGERLTFGKSVAVIVSFAGTAMTVGPQLDARPLGVVLGISAAIIYSIYIMAGTRLLKRAGPVSSSTVIMSAAAVAYGILAATTGFAAPATGSGWLGVIGVAIVSTVVAVTAFLAGLAFIGPTKASVLSTFEPVTTVLLAALFLDEPVTVWTFIGGACILAGAVALALLGRPLVRRPVTQAEAAGPTGAREGWRMPTRGCPRMPKSDIVADKRNQER